MERRKELGNELPNCKSNWFIVFLLQPPAEHPSGHFGIHWSTGLCEINACTRNPIASPVVVIVVVVVAVVVVVVVVGGGVVVVIVCVILESENL